VKLFNELGFALYIYALLSVFALMFRLAEMDCKHRYVDYVFPFSKIHCEVSGP
jgi:hypothetical protein